jgi:glutamate/tyrosine decarboxylase-like PLP-dependent enzyme
MATAWAVMHHLGIEGYKQLTATTIDAVGRMSAGIRSIDGLTVLGEPEAHITTIAAAPGWDDRVDVFALGDALHERGWHLDRQQPPDSLHATVSAGNAPVMDDFLRDLRECAAQVLGTRADDRSTNYATLE